jgi:DNA (cytosine-5)-methyltransferase 1
VDVAAYYNEIDPYAAQWLRNLIAAGHIAPGDVDERSIEDVRPDDLKPYAQCHFFAGIGVWSYALRNAGWSDDRPVWTGSCPCQPFSAAGKGAGFDDERHLWPVWHWLIEQCKPAVIFGEQVSSKAVEPWIDLVSVDLEGLDYAFGALAFPSAGVGAPHIRDRAYFMADADRERFIGVDALLQRKEPGWFSRNRVETPRRGEARELADAHLVISGQGGALDGWRNQGSDAQSRTGLSGSGVPVGMGDTNNAGLEGRRVPAERARELFAGAPGVAGRWADADWIYCRDEKWRPVEPGTFPLADGAPSRVGRLRAYGNAINAEAACAFIEAASEALDEYDLI